LGNGTIVFGEVLDDTGKGKRVSVETRLIESLVNNLVELGLSPAGQKRIELSRVYFTLIKLLR